MVEDVVKKVYICGDSKTITKNLNIMKKIFSCALLTIVVMMLTGCGAGRQFSKTDTGSFKYELEGMSNAAQGSYLVKVWTYTNTKRADIELCKKNAVHGIIFKGYAGSGNVRPQGPLVKEPGAESRYADYFGKFFADGGEYNKYVKVTGGSQQVVKVGKSYQVGVVVSVSKDQLRKALEAAGVVKSLGHGF